MKSSTRLESVIFQLTPTRTRYDLFIVANGKKEKVASGLLNPFLAHLKTAEEQIAKGGYSIILEPKADDDAMWFTKGTVERFVRFVSTPEILERVYTVENEIVQIEKAILIQGSNDNGLTTVNDHQAKPVLRIEAFTGSNPRLDADEKAIVLYAPGSQPPETDGSVAQEGNPKVQLLKVLETRINVLQKEQGMAFARAAAAGFDIDHMTPLVSFAKCFGATRLMDACLRFLDLLKRKHESGQWLKIEAAEAMSRKEELLTSNASGILHNEMGSEMASESNGKAGADGSAGIRLPVNHQSPYGQQEYFPGQYHPHPTFSPWPMHMSPGGVPFYQGHPMQTSYYQNYSPNGSYYPPPYQAVENSHLDVGHRAGQKRQSMDGVTVSDTVERDFVRVNSHGDLEEKETSHTGPGKKSGISRRKRSGTVVVRNINFITSEQSDSSGRDSSSESENELDKNDGNLLDKPPNMTDQDYLRSSKRKGSEAKRTTDLLLFDKDEAINADGGHWQAFQNCLLRDTEENTRAPSDAMFAMEKNVLVKRPQNTVNHDPLAFVERNRVELQGTRLTEFQKDDGDVSNFPRATSDGHSTFREDGPCHNGILAADVMHMTGVNGRKISYINDTNEYMIGGRESQSNLRSSSDLALHGYEAATDNLAYMADESFILPFRSMSVSQVSSDGRALIDINNELPVRHQNSEDIGSKIGKEVNFEPNELRLLPERGSEKRTIGYDPALDHEKQFCNGDIASVDMRNMGSVADGKQVSKKTENDRKSRAVSETLNKKKSGGPIIRAKPLKTNPLEEARVRAERLRSYKADLQKLKKEKEEAEQRRIEALKLERKKRIAARGSVTSGQPVFSSSRKSLPAKLSPISQKGSKFSDSEPGSSSPLQRSKIRTTLFGATDSNVSKITKSSEGSHKTVNKLTRSVPERKKEPIVFAPDSKASMARIRRLSEPKTISSHPASSSVKIGTAGPGPKVKASNGVEDKKISAVVNLDAGKTSAHLELMTEPSKGTSKVNQRKSAVKEMTMEINGRKSSVTSENDKLNIIDDRISHHDLDDDPVIEKTVVMLECQKPYVPVVTASQEKMRVTEKHSRNNVTGDKPLAVPKYMAVHATTSPMDRDHKEPTTVRSLELPCSREVTANIEEKKYANLPSPSALVECNQAPIARLSSLEDPSQKAQPSSIGSASVETGKLHYSGFKNRKLEETPAAFEKPRVKEPSKGFRRLLKLGRKNHDPPAGEEIAASDIASGSEPFEFVTKADSILEVHTLKNLMSQDETPTAGSTTSQKSSRHFSLLSSFRSKTSDKKLQT